MKMIVMDLDGTLLNQECKVSETSRNYFKQVKEKGYIVVIATGRIYQSVLHTTEQATFANFLITNTGSCCYKGNGDSIFETSILKEDVIKIVNEINEEEMFFIDIGTKHKIYKYSKMFMENNSYVKTSQDKNLFFKKFKEAFHISIVFKENTYTLNTYDRLLKKFPELEISLMQDSFGSKKWIDILPKGCNKYSAIQKLAENLKISNEEILAFGDGLNDIEMIKKCGKGIAMKNALEEVKKVSNAVTEISNDENGVVCYLQKHFNI